MCLRICDRVMKYFRSLFYGSLENMILSLVGLMFHFAASSLTFIYSILFLFCP